MNSPPAPSQSTPKYSGTRPGTALVDASEIPGPVRSRLLASIRPSWDPVVTKIYSNRGHFKANTIISSDTSQNLAARLGVIAATVAAVVLLGCSGQAPEPAQAPPTSSPQQEPETPSGLLLSDARIDGDTLTLTYDSPLDEGSVPGTRSYLVEASLLPVDVEAVTIDGSSVVLKLSSGVQAGQPVIVSFTSQPARPLLSTSGALAPPLQFEPIENITAVTVPGLVEARVDGAFIELAYGEELNRGATVGSAALEAFDVRVDGLDRDVVDVWAEGTVATLLLAWPVSAGETVAVSYALPDRPESRLQDVAAPTLQHSQIVPCATIRRCRCLNSGASSLATVKLC